jgi:rSAM/selenodomain-associated transferase 2
MISTPRKISDISIIIPTLNEEANISALALHLADVDCEVIVVDGGSCDRTIEMAGSCGFKVFKGKAGKARQLNQGAAAAGGRILLFLHADTRLPEKFDAVVRQTMSDTSAIAGAFRLALDTPTPAMRFIVACANLRSLLFRLPYGDQALFVRRDDFFKLGMFPELPIMEDFAFIKAAKNLGKIVLVKEYAVTSARRWQRLGIVRTTLINQLIVLGYYLRISPKRLALLYNR